jgi:hypothetical protein
MEIKRSADFYEFFVAHKELILPHLKSTTVLFTLLGLKVPPEAHAFFP